MLHRALEGAIMLESFPKTTVDVFALVLESGGSKLQLHFKDKYYATLDLFVNLIFFNLQAIFLL